MPDLPDPTPPRGIADLSPVVSGLRSALLAVLGLNVAYGLVEATVALRIGSVSLLADSVDFFEDATVALLVVLALGWSLAGRARVGRVLAVVLLVPAAAALWRAWTVLSGGDPAPPPTGPLVATALGAIAVNTVCALLLARHRRQGGSMGRAAFLSARNDVVTGVLILVMAAVTAATRSGWPDLVLGVVIAAVCLWSAREVWTLASEERLASRALAGDPIG